MLFMNHGAFEAKIFSNTLIFYEFYRVLDRFQHFLTIESDSSVFLNLCDT